MSVKLKLQQRHNEAGEALASDPITAAPQASSHMRISRRRIDGLNTDTTSARGTAKTNPRNFGREEQEFIRRDNGKK